VFGSVVAIIFQSVFYLEMHQKIYIFFKKLFLISLYQNNLKKNQFEVKKKIKNFKFFQKRF
jgi:hypothetical protein